ncbi:MAG: DUF1343 domain-containing protein, partial [Spirochaetaceae bacterium]|nr:DUF1343 domain-containing protein [Spirochaetaceae bacterium]
MTRSGLDRLAADPRLLARRLGSAEPRLGLVANPTSVTADLKRSVEVVQGAGRLLALFGPEHGFYGEAQAGEPVADGRDEATGLPVHSLYGAAKRPRRELLRGLDALVFDIQDSGLRWYTYLSTLVAVIEELDALAAEGPAPALVVLDRPNPLSGAVVEGMALEPAFASFVGALDLPARHGLTLGEAARLAAARRGPRIRLDVVELEGWSRGRHWPETGLPWVPPSPNLPTFDSNLAYAATTLLEGTNISEGRGTTRPFEIFGAPWIGPEALARELESRRLPGLAFRPCRFVPGFSKHSGEPCGGVQLHVRDRAAARMAEAGY